MKITPKFTASLLTLVWPLCIVSSILFILAKVVYPVVDWAVVVCAILLFPLGIMLRSSLKLSLADHQN